MALDRESRKRRCGGFHITNIEEAMASKAPRRGNAAW
jgi:hypothetical protein